MKKFLFIIISFLAFSQSANATLIGTDTVDGRNSLYFESWGHPYSGAWGGGNAEENNAQGVGQAARAFQVSGNAYGFSSGDKIQITATGCVVDINGTTCTGPDYMGGDFRDLPVYALIGIWSTSSTLISLIDTAIINPAFLIGSFLDLIVPDYSSPLYLFMATNDGNFSDNSGAYNVRIDTLSSVPAPSVFWLMLFGLLFRKKIGFC
jgi:hypothetical protein